MQRRNVATNSQPTRSTGCNTFTLSLTVIPPTAIAVPPPFCFAKKRDRLLNTFNLFCGTGKPVPYGMLLQACTLRDMGSCTLRFELLIPNFEIQIIIADRRSRNLSLAICNFIHTQGKPIRLARCVQLI